MLRITRHIRRREVGAYQKLTEWSSGEEYRGRLIIVLSLIVGLSTGLAAFILKFLVRKIEYLLTEGCIDISQMNWLYLVYPAVGILITALFIKYVVRDDISHGVTKILYALSMKRARIKSHNRWTSVVASSLTIGFGGSVGAEAPIVLTGSAIGSSLGKRFHLPPQTIMLLVGCGAAGAIAGIFKAPIAGLMFVIEVLMLDLTMKSLLPLLTTSITSVCVSYALYGTEHMFSFSVGTGFSIDVIPACIALGVFGGFISLYFTRSMNAFEKVFAKIKTRWAKFALGASVLGVLIFFLPSLYGEGYGVISELLNDTTPLDVMDHSFFDGGENTLLMYLGLVLMMKVFASTATNGGGGCGGVFAPSLFVGAIGGFIFAMLWNKALGLSPDASFYAHPSNFALFGMTGLMSGVMHAPLTGIFLIAELTGGYEMFVPLMIVSAMSYTTITHFEPHSIYAMRLARKGELITHDKDNAILTVLNMETLIEKNYMCVEPEWNLTKVVIAVEKSRRNIFPVVNKANQLVGVMSLDSIRKYMFRPELYKQYKVTSFMKDPPAVLSINDTLKEATSKFDETNAWNLPVVDNNGEYVGFISRSGLFSAYRKTLVDITAE